MGPIGGGGRARANEHRARRGRRGAPIGVAASRGKTRRGPFLFRPVRRLFGECWLKQDPLWGGEQVGGIEGRCICRRCPAQHRVLVSGAILIDPVIQVNACHGVMDLQLGPRSALHRAAVGRHSSPKDTH